jgi:hypothetical protein
MSHQNRVRRWFCIAASTALAALSAVAAATAGAQETGTRVDISEVQSVDLKTAPEIPAVLPPAGLVINRPTMPMADYVAAKDAAAAHPGSRGAPSGAAAPPSTYGVTLYTQIGSVNESQTTGGTQFPPGGDIATSAQWMVQVVNDQVVMYNWNTNAFKQVSLNTLFQDATDFLFDPRVIWDLWWDRFVVLVAGCASCSINQGLFKLAVSQTGDPSGAWWLHQHGPFASNDFYDFPQLGMDLNSILVTYNEFTTSISARLIAFDKAHAYNGFGFGGVLFYAGSCTLAPPYLTEKDISVDFVLSFCPNDNKIKIYQLQNSSNNDVSLTGPIFVNVNSYGIPPNAVQPGVDYPLDTGDNRFENRSLQRNYRLINAATINNNGVPTPAFYVFNYNGSQPTLVSNGTWYASFSSYDWHPSVVANTVAIPNGSGLGEVFVTWMSTDPQNNVNLQLRAGGWLGDNGFTIGVPVYTSPLPLTGQTDSVGRHRSGDYTYITTYPAAALGCQAREVGLLTGEVAAATAGLWSTRVGIVKHC